MKSPKPEERWEGGLAGYLQKSRTPTDLRACSFVLRTAAVSSVKGIEAFRIS